MKSAARSFTDWPGFMNSALPRMVQPVSSEARLSLMRGVRPTAAATPSTTVTRALSHGERLCATLDMGVGRARRSARRRTRAHTAGAQQSGLHLAETLARYMCAQPHSAGAAGDRPAGAAAGGAASGFAGVAELVDALDLGSSDASRGGSSPSARTKSWRPRTSDTCRQGVWRAAAAIEAERCKSPRRVPQASSASSRWWSARASSASASPRASTRSRTRSSSRASARARCRSPTSRSCTAAR